MMKLNESASHSLLELHGVSKRYDATSYALKDVDLSVAPGEFVSVIGLSGAGKSTLLRCINRLIESTSGEVIFNGEEMARLRGRKLRHARRRIDDDLPAL